MKNSLNFALSLILSACGGMDPKPDTNTPGMTPDTTVGEMVYYKCTDSHVSWIAGKTIACDIDASFVQGEATLIDRGEDGCFMSSLPVDGILVSQAPVDLEEMPPNQRNALVPPMQVSQGSQQLQAVLRRQNNDGQDYLTEIPCSIQ